MSERNFPRFGCSFCTTNRDKLEQLMRHLDDHLSEIMNAKMKPRRPAGDHALPLIRAVRRTSGRQGANSLITLKHSVFDDCRNWRLYDIIPDEAAYGTFMRRECRSKQDWMALAVKFLALDDVALYTADERGLRHSYVPDWSMLDEPKPADEQAASVENQDDPKTPPRKATASASSLVRSSIRSSIVDARNQNVSVSHVTPSGGANSTFTLNGTTQDASMNRDLGRHRDFAVVIKKEADPGRYFRLADPDDATGKGKGKGKATAHDIIDLTTPVKPARPADDDFDIATPQRDKTITLYVKCFDANGLYEVSADCTLDAAIALVEARMKGVSVKCFRVRGERVTREAWEGMGGVRVVMADWEFGDDE